MTNLATRRAAIVTARNRADLNRLIPNPADGQFALQQDDLIIYVWDKDLDVWVATASLEGATGDGTFDNIYEATPGHGVNVDGVLLKDGAIVGPVDVVGDLGVTGDLDVTGALTGANADLSGTLLVDTIGEHTPNAGVTVDGVLLKDGDITANDGTFTGALAAVTGNFSGLLTAGSLAVTGGATLPSIVGNPDVTFVTRHILGHPTGDFDITVDGGFYLRGGNGQTGLDLSATNGDVDLFATDDMDLSAGGTFDLSTQADITMTSYGGYTGIDLDNGQVFITATVNPGGAWGSVSFQAAELVPALDSSVAFGTALLRWSTGYFDDLDVGTSLTVPTLILTSGILNTAAATNLVLQRAGVTQLTLGSLTATFAGDLTVNGAVSLGDSSSDNITFTGRAASTFVPALTNTYSLGSSSNQWANGFFGTEVVTPSVDSGGAVNLVLQRNNVTQLTLASLAATFAGSLTVTTTSTLLGQTTLGATADAAAFPVVFARDLTTGTAIGARFYTFNNGVQTEAFRLERDEFEVFRTVTVTTGNIGITAGTLGVGGSTQTFRSIGTQNTLSGSTTQRAIEVVNIYDATATTARGVMVNPTFTNNGATTTNYQGLYVAAAVLGGGTHAITTVHGLYIEAQTVGTTNRAITTLGGVHFLSGPIYPGSSDATHTLGGTANAYSSTYTRNVDSGSANNLVLKRNAVDQLTLGSLAATFAGSLLVTTSQSIGTTLKVGTTGAASADNGIWLSDLASTAVTTLGIRSDPRFPSTTTTLGAAGYFNFRTAAASFTMTNGAALTIPPVSLGAGSAVTNGLAINIDAQDWTGGTTTNAYGIRIGNISGATTNYAIKTGTGLVDFGDHLNIASGKEYRVNGVKVTGGRVTGYTNAMTGTKNRATAYDTGTITLVQLAERVGALLDDLTTHGLIGV